MCPPTCKGCESGLDALASRVHHDLELLAYPARPWVAQQTHPSGQHVYDVIIVGGGQCGLATAFGLKREQVGLRVC